MTIDGLLRPLGRWGNQWLRYGQALFVHFVRTVSSMFRDEGAGVVRQTAVAQIYFTGVDAVPVVAGLGLILGGVIIVQGLWLLTGTGAEEFLGRLLQVVVFRELGPLMAALIVIGRSGSSITVELGNMAVGRELSLLEAMGVDLHRLIVLPRLIGVTVSVVCLCILFDTVAVMGGFAVARGLLGVPAVQFARIVGSFLMVTDLALTVVKSVLFGALITTVATWQGMAVGRAVTEVPQATRRSVVHSLVLCFVIDLWITVAFYMGGGG